VNNLYFNSIDFGPFAFSIEPFFFAQLCRNTQVPALGEEEDVWEACVAAAEGDRLL
jgi:hypothetical protein